MKKKLIPYVLAVLLMASALVCTYILGQKNEASAFQQATGASSISFRVVNGRDNQPIQGAKVVIPETGGVYYTDQSGLTPAISVPILTDSSYESILPQPWGEISVLAFKKNYADYALFHCQVLPGRPRGPLDILLFPKNDNTVFALIESPDNKWVQELLDKYRNATEASPKPR